jgi:hypothetical protein
MTTTYIIMDITTGPTTTTDHGWVLKAEGCRQVFAITGIMKSAVTETKNIAGTTATENITMAVGTDLEREIETKAVVGNIAVTKVAVVNIVVVKVMMEKVDTNKGSIKVIRYALQLARNQL